MASTPLVFLKRFLSSDCLASIDTKNEKNLVMGNNVGTMVFKAA